MPTKILFHFRPKTKTKVTCASNTELGYGSVANFNIFDATQMTFFCARMIIKLHDRKIFTESTTLLVLTNIFVTRMLTRDLFAVANLLVISGKIAYRGHL